MFEIDGHGITLTRGDSFSFAITLKGRVVANGCRAVFSVKAKSSDAECVLQKTAIVNSRKVSFEISPEETEGLKAKSYHWSLRVIDGDGNVYTPIADERFAIAEVIG